MSQSTIIPYCKQYPWLSRVTEKSDPVAEVVYIGSFRRAFDHHCVDKVLGTKGGDLGSALHGRMVLRALLPSHLMTENPYLGRVWRILPGGCWEKKDGSCQKHLKLSERQQKHLKSSKVVCLEATIATSLGSPNVSGLSSLVISALAMRELKSEVYAKNMVGVLKHGVASRALEETWHPKQLSKSHETSSRFWGMRELSKWWV